MAAPNAMVERGEKLRKATRDLLIESPEMPKQEMHQKVLERTGFDNTLGGWEVTYYYPVRKELREQGVIGNGKKPTAKGVNVVPRTKEDPGPAKVRPKKTAQDRGRRPRPDYPLKQAKSLAEVDAERPTSKTSGNGVPDSTDLDVPEEDNVPDAPLLADELEVDLPEAGEVTPIVSLILVRRNGKQFLASETEPGKWRVEMDVGDVSLEDLGDLMDLEPIQELVFPGLF